MRVCGINSARTAPQTCSTTARCTDSSQCQPGHQIDEAEDDVIGRGSLHRIETCNYSVATGIALQYTFTHLPRRNGQNVPHQLGQNETSPSCEVERASGGRNAVHTHPTISRRGQTWKSHRHQKAMASPIGTSTQNPANTDGIGVAGGKSRPRARSFTTRSACRKKHGRHRLKHRTAQSFYASPSQGSQ